MPTLKLHVLGIAGSEVAHGSHSAGPGHQETTLWPMLADHMATLSLKGTREPSLMTLVCQEVLVHI